MSDSRIEKIATGMQQRWPHANQTQNYWETEAAQLIADVEEFDLTVIDRTDPAVIDRVARKLCDQYWFRQPPGAVWSDITDDTGRDAWRHEARTVLAAALGGDRDE